MAFKIYKDYMVLKHTVTGVDKNGHETEGFIATGVKLKGQQVAAVDIASINNREGSLDRVRLSLQVTASRMTSDITTKDKIFCGNTNYDILEIDSLTVGPVSKIIHMEVIQ